jgi:hypothetical protein
VGQLGFDTRRKESRIEKLGTEREREREREEEEEEEEEEGFGEMMH